MITDYYIHIESDWQNLPWQHINGRIALIQKKIFEASRQYNLEVLYRIQNYLLNSNEARLFAINKIMSGTNRYYKIYNHENYCYEDIDKFYLFKYLFNYNPILKVNLKFILEQIKEYLIYLCIEPEWKARLYPLKIKDINRKYYKLVSLKMFLDHLNWNKIICYTKYIPYISKHIYYWLNNKFFVKDQYCVLTYLPNLLLTVYDLETKWHKIKLSKWNYLCTELNEKYIKTRFYFIFITIIKNHLFSFYDYLNNIIIEIKTKFYNKNYFNRSKLNNQLKWVDIIHITTFILQTKLYAKIQLLNYLYIINIINTINLLLSCLKIYQNYHHMTYLLNYYTFNLFNMLYKKITLSCLYQYSFKVSR